MAKKNVRTISAGYARLCAGLLLAVLLAAGCSSGGEEVQAGADAEGVDPTPTVTDAAGATFAPTTTPAATQPTAT